jgi:hypothetical protein
MKNYSLLAVALIVCAGAAEMKRTSMMTIDKNVFTDQQVGSAAFRDGSYQGKQAAERGDALHMSVGRWATNADRVLFSNGYSQAYIQNLAQNAATPQKQGDGAAFRDGLYLGKLDSEHCNTRHVAVGRWSKASDRVSFAEGYTQAYGDESSESGTQRNLMHQASLIR